MSLRDRGDGTLEFTDGRKEVTKEDLKITNEQWLEENRCPRCLSQVFDWCEEEWQDGAFYMGGDCLSCGLEFREVYEPTEVLVREPSPEGLPQDWVDLITARELGINRKKGELYTLAKAVVCSLEDFFSDDPHKDWAESLRDGLDALNHLIEEIEKGG